MEVSLAKRRILVGQIFQESHSFNPLPTAENDFVVERGPVVLEHRRSGSTLGGIIRRLEAEGCDLIPVLAARARPGGPVEHDFYEALKKEFLQAAKSARPDAVVLELHGAMSTTEIDDAEGDLMRSIRDVLGRDPIVGIGLDLHAHVSTQLLEAVDICTGCKENPHSDVVETGERVAHLVLKQCDGSILPVSAYVRLPMLLQGGSETSEWPLADLHGLAREALAQNERLLDVSIFNVHPFNDAPDIGQVIVGIADGDFELAGRICERIALVMWERRDDFRTDFPSLDECLDQIAAQRESRPFVLADRGDRVLAGAPGDSTVILRCLLERGQRLKAVVPITDPESVERAWLAGIGKTIDLEVGGKITPGFEPTPIRGTVLHLSHGDFVQKGPYQAGQPSTLGRTALIQIDAVTVMLTSVAGMTQDTAAFTSLGIDISQHDLVVTKSGNHFKLSFAGVASPLVADTPGMGAYRKGFFSHRKARPIYPEDVIDRPDLSYRTIAPKVIPQWQ